MPPTSPSLPDSKRPRIRDSPPPPTHALAGSPNGARMLLHDMYASDSSTDANSEGEDVAVPLRLHVDFRRDCPYLDTVNLQVEVEILPLYSSYGLGLTTWGPLASGVLTSKYNNGDVPSDSRLARENFKMLASRRLEDNNMKKVQKLEPIANELGVPLSQLVTAWCASNPHVSSVITGATKESQIKENMKAIDVIPRLTPDVLEKIEAVVQSNEELPDNFHERGLLHYYGAFVFILAVFPE